MNPRLPLTLCAAAALAAVVLPQAPAQAPPDTQDVIFFNGDIVTGAGFSEAWRGHAPERVTAIAVTGERILAAGTDQEILALKSPATRLIDLGGAFVMPGFNDAHTHMAQAGLQKLSLDLDNVPSLRAMQARVKAYAATLAPGQWITGGGWDHTKWPSVHGEHALPTRKDLDAVSGGHPLVLARTDGHIAVLNSAALAACGITATTRAPEGGAIDLDPRTRQPTGIVRDTALQAVDPHIPPPDAATRRKALELAIQDALAHGVTSVQDFSDHDDFVVLQALEQEGNLPLRFTEWMPFDLPLGDLEKYRASQSQNDTMLHTGQLKAFMDGSLGSRTAAMLAPYADDAKNSGLPRYDQAKLNAMSAERAVDGFQLGFHAIGDRGNRMALDAFQAAIDAVHAAYRRHLRPNAPEPDWKRLDRMRFRVEHAQVVAPEDFARFAAEHVIASMQPSHLLTDMAWAGQRLGPERSRFAYAWKTFLDHGVVLAFGTDYPVESISPFRGVYSAITRQNETGTQTFQPQEKLSLNQALYAYTQGSAFAEYAEANKGLLIPGYLADFIVLDRDLTKASPQQILHARVLETIVGGRVRYDARNSSGSAPKP